MSKKKSEKKTAKPKANAHVNPLFAGILAGWSGAVTPKAGAVR
jgi:hypothetical protein